MIGNSEFLSLRIIIFVALLLLLPGTLGITEYVNDSHIVMVQSTQPCTLHGDSDLYGLGVRISFYLQFGVGLVGVWVGATKEIKSLRLGFNTLFSALLILLLRNGSRGSFAMLEWNIVAGLTLLLPLVMLPPSWGPIEEITARLDEGLESTNEEAIDHEAAATPSIHLPSRRAASLDVEAGQQPDVFDEVSLGDETQDVTDRQGLPPPARASNEPRSSVDLDRNLKKKEPLAEETNDPFDRIVRQSSYERHRSYLTDPVGIGYLLFLYAIFMLCQPWLQFVQRDVGHKTSCPVLIIWVAPINPYNPHWMRLFKIIAINSIFFGGYLLILGLICMLEGIFYWHAFEGALKTLDNKIVGAMDLMEMKSAIKLLAEDTDSSSASSLSASIASQSPFGGKGGDTLEKAREDIALINGRIAAQHSAKEDAKAIWLRTKRTMSSYKDQKKMCEAIQRIKCVTLAIIGGASIACTERTISLNHIVMADAISASTGQSLSLLVAVFSSISFFFEYYKKWKREYKQFNKLEREYYELIGSAKVIVYKATTEIGRWVPVKENIEEVAKKLQRQKNRSTSRAPSRQPSNASNTGRPPSVAPSSTSWMGSLSSWSLRPKPKSKSEQQRLLEVIVEGS